MLKLPKPRVLVVDDDACMRDLLRVHLTNAGYRVDLAEDAVVAGRVLLALPPDLLILDVQMPYLNGIDLLSAVRAEPGLGGLPVLVISSSEDFEHAALRLDARYLVKPFTTDALLRSVATALGTRGGRPRPATGRPDARPDSTPAGRTGFAD